MDRPDLISAFTKIELWRQTQYSKIVYFDADVVALRAPDELLTLDKDFAAVPDIGWPDCFNTGVMVLRPNLQDYYSLLALAQRGISFDGADQGLLNMHFRDWHRLSFTYNCTPSGNYQYLPAYRHFGSTINMIHYIGQQKPWNMDRQAVPFGGPYRELLGKWWEVYDRHYRPRATRGIHHGPGSFAIEQRPDNLVGDNIRPVSVSAIPIPEQDNTQRSTSSREPHKGDQIYPPETPTTVQETHKTQHEDHEKQSMYIPTSIVPQYVRGEQHLAAHEHHHFDLPHHPRPDEKHADQGNASHPSWNPLPPISEQPQHIERAPSRNTTEPSIPEPRSSSPPRMEWDASRYVLVI